jgi:hypothetical protein
MPPRARSATHVKIALLEARKPFLGCSFSNGVFSVDGANVSGGLCSFGASIELVKKVSEMFIFLNLTLHSFGPENFVPLVQIGTFQKGLIEENEINNNNNNNNNNSVLYIENMQLLLGNKSAKTKAARTYAPTQSILCQQP